MSGGRCSLCDDENMQEILTNIDSAVKAGQEKARKANAVEPLLAPDVQRVWNDLVCMCRVGGYSSINAASVTRRKAIIAVDDVLRANDQVEHRRG